MPGKSLSMEKRTQIVTMRKEGKSITSIAKEMGISVNTASIWCRRGASGNIKVAVQRKKGSGRPKKTSQETDNLIKRLVMVNPTITCREIKTQLPDVLAGVSERTIRHRVKSNLGLPSPGTAKRPQLTDNMKKRRVDFCKKYKDWSNEDWEHVVFSDESCFYVTPCAVKRVRQLHGSNCCDSKYYVKTMKHAVYVMVWGCFSGKGGRGCLYFLPKNNIMRSDSYVKCLQENLLLFKDKLHMKVFMQDGDPCHHDVKAKDFFRVNNIDLLDWPCNSPDLNPIENVWRYMKRKLAAMDTSSVPKLIDAIKKIWHKDMDKKYFKALAHTMKKRVNFVLKHKGNMQVLNRCNDARTDDGEDDVWKEGKKGERESKLVDDDDDGDYDENKDEDEMVVQMFKVENESSSFLDDDDYELCIKEEPLLIKEEEEEEEWMTMQREEEELMMMERMVKKDDNDSTATNNSSGISNGKRPSGEDATTDRCTSRKRKPATKDPVTTEAIPEKWVCQQHCQEEEGNYAHSDTDSSSRHHSRLGGTLSSEGKNNQVSGGNQATERQPAATTSRVTSEGEQRLLDPDGTKLFDVPKILPRTYHNLLEKLCRLSLEEPNAPQLTSMDCKNLLQKLHELEMEKKTLNEKCRKLMKNSSLEFENQQKQEKPQILLEKSTPCSSAGDQHGRRTSDYIINFTEVPSYKNEHRDEELPVDNKELNEKEERRGDGSKTSVVRRRRPVRPRETEGGQFTEGQTHMKVRKRSSWKSIDDPIRSSGKSIDDPFRSSATTDDLVRAEMAEAQQSQKVSMDLEAQWVNGDHLEADLTDPLGGDDKDDPPEDKTEPMRDSFVKDLQGVFHIQTGRRRVGQNTRKHNS